MTINIQMSWVTWPTWPHCPYMVKNLKKSSSPKPIDQWPWNLVCSIVYASTTKIVQIMTLGWLWPILRQGQIWSHWLLFEKKWILFIFFGNYCSLKSQSCLKHSAKWAYEVEWVSKVGGHSLILIKGHSDFNVKTCFSQTQLGDWESKFIWKLKGEWKWK